MEHSRTRRVVRRQDTEALALRQYKQWPCLSISLPICLSLFLFLLRLAKDEENEVKDLFRLLFIQVTS